MTRCLLRQGSLVAAGLLATAFCAQAQLLPATPAARARARMLEDLCDTYYEAINWAVMEIRVFGRASGALGEQLLARATDQVAGVNAYLDRQLGEQPWFGGATFGWADLAIVPHVHAAALTGLSRIALGMHYPSDVVAGMLVGLGSALLVTRAGGPWITRLVALVSRVTDPLLRPLWNRVRSLSPRT